MPCYSPLVAFRSEELNSSGKRSFVFNRKKSLDGVPHKLPCGQCIGCRLEYSRQWAVRCLHEASLYSANCFITLTYDDKHLPGDLSLKKDHYQKFMKRLRKRFDGIDPVSDSSGVSYPIRYYHCGEYGELRFRPHYHAILFNFDFPDKVFWKKSVDGSPLYLSPALQELWSFGFSSIGSVTFDSAAYVARYVMKKVNGDMKEGHYRRFDSSTGEVIDLQPEYCTMSRRPGIANRWYDEWKDDVYPHDYVVVNGVRCKPPKYYDGLYELDDPDDYVRLKSNRKINALKHVDNNSYLRLAVREKVQKARLTKLVRNVE